MFETNDSDLRFGCVCTCIVISPISKLHFILLIVSTIFNKDKYKERTCLRANKKKGFQGLTTGKELKSFF